MKMEKGEEEWEDLEAALITFAEIIEGERLGSFPERETHRS